jgi:aryl-phospho-beta-D-glucosidase BglC (GH1 family)
VCRGINYTLNPDLAGLTQMQVVDKVIAYARIVGLKVILDHHSNEGMYYASQQDNGLWFDLGSGSNGTDSRDGKGDVGTVTAEQFQADWVQVARRYARNDAVIGFDLDNEMHIAGNGGKLNWGQGGPCDIHAMFVNVGNAIQAVNPGALIICEGPIDTYSDPVVHQMMDLRGVATMPVTLHRPNKVLYSVHEYPNIRNDSGPAYIKRLNAAWGFLVEQNIAPVWIGEMGESMDFAHDDVSIARQIAWGNTLLSYMDGTAPDGPRFKGKQQPISGDWWLWGDQTGGVPDGCLDKTGNVRPSQAGYINAMLFRPR